MSEVGSRVAVAASSLRPSLKSRRGRRHGGERIRAVDVSLQMKTEAVVAILSSVREHVLIEHQDSISMCP